MIIAGRIFLIIGILALIGGLIGSAGITLYSFFFPVLGVILLIVGYARKQDKWNLNNYIKRTSHITVKLDTVK